MRKLFIAFSFLFLQTYICSAQPGNNNRFDRLEAIKMAYITKQLNLSTDEAQKFWPVYNSYSDEIRKTRESNMSDELVFEEKALAIRKRYKPEFSRVLNSEERVNNVFTIERNYRDLLKKELINRQKPGNRRNNNNN
ncbi:MAG: hypothetical protein JWN76_959 [Chitinophagaceae bacterium]|nr:hypothetical protein [Chitinophagaceae bacterium]